MLKSGGVCKKMFFLPKFRIFSPSAEECETRDGRASGTCADGYGVCCVCKIKFKYIFLNSYGNFTLCVFFNEKSHHRLRRDVSGERDRFRVQGGRAGEEEDKFVLCGKQYFFYKKNLQQEGGCLATVCKVNDNICQVRLVQKIILKEIDIPNNLLRFVIYFSSLDFNSFSLAGPSTISVSTALDLV